MEPEVTTIRNSLGAYTQAVESLLKRDLPSPQTINLVADLQRIQNNQLKDAVMVTNKLYEKFSQ